MNPDMEYPWIELTAEDWLRLSTVQVGLARGDRDVYTSRELAERLIAKRKQFLRRLIAILELASIAEEVPHA